MSGKPCGKCQAPDAPNICARCRLIYYCNKSCQTSHWKAHKVTCIPETTQGVTIYCHSERAANGLFSAVTVPQDHPIHRASYDPPVPRKVGIPLKIYRSRIDRSKYTTHPDQNNQIVTYLMIEADNGFAPFEWQDDIGTVTVIRADYKHLTTLEIETIWQYISDILSNHISDDTGLVSVEQTTKAKFREFCEKFKASCLRNGRAEFEGLTLPIGK